MTLEDADNQLFFSACPPRMNSEAVTQSRNKAENSVWVESEGMQGSFCWKDQGGLARASSWVLVGEEASRGCMYKKCLDEAQERSKRSSGRKGAMNLRTQQWLVALFVYPGGGLGVGRVGMLRQDWAEEEITASAAAASWLYCL